MKATFGVVLAVFVLAAAGCKKDGGAGEGGPGKPGGGAPGAGQAGAGGRGGGPGGRGPMKFPVQVAPVTTRDVEYSIDAVGNVEAFERVQVTARVQGVVEKVDFAEGLEVKKGQVLAEIEPARYQLAVDAARAALEQASAQQGEAKAALARREAVNQANPGLIPGEELESFRTRAATAGAEREARRVALEQAKLNLRDAYVRAPAAGIIETRTVQTGQFAQPGAVLATLVRRDPLLLRFKVAELDAHRLQPGMKARFRTRDTTEPYLVRITHVGQAADPASRMVEITTEVIDERRGELRPGTFAQVTVPVSVTRAPVIPQTAVRPSERGFLAYVVDDKDVAHERIVQLGMRTADGMVEVKEGLAQGERLVIRGGEALREGAQVRLVEGPGSELTGEGSRSEVRGRGHDGGTPRGAP